MNSFHAVVDGDPEVVLTFRANVSALKALAKHMETMRNSIPVHDESYERLLSSITMAASVCTGRYRRDWSDP